MSASRPNWGGFRISGVRFDGPSLGFPLSIFEADPKSKRKEARMTLLDLGRIAARYETEMAHAMLHAVAVAKCEGGGKWVTV